MNIALGDQSKFTYTHLTTRNYLIHCVGITPATAAVFRETLLQYEFQLPLYHMAAQAVIPMEGECMGERFVMRVVAPEPVAIQCEGFVLWDAKL